MKHKGTIRLETERLILRRFQVEDAEDAYNNWMADSEVTKFLTWKPHTSEEVSAEFISECVKEYAEDTYYHWAIVLKGSYMPIGAIRAGIIREKVSYMDVGYCIGKEWWNKGITSEALQAVINFLFKEVGALRIEARHDVQNVNSGKVMQKCGMQYEGILRKASWNNQGICDVCVYSMIKGDT